VPLRKSPRPGLEGKECPPTEGRDYDSQPHTPAPVDHAVHNAHEEHPACNSNKRVTAF
jgi:hypothetical protein